MKDSYDFSKATRGPVLSSKGKTRITIFLDDDLVEHFRGQGDAHGMGYQTMINACLRSVMEAQKDPGSVPVTVSVLKKELARALKPVHATSQPPVDTRRRKA